jgi:chorismate synthase
MSALDALARGIEDVQDDVQRRRTTNKIYRSASGTPDSLTPRSGVDDVAGGGLSFFDSLNNPGVKPGKYVEVDTSKLVTLIAIPDNNPPGHVTVTPGSLQALQDWAATRGTGQLHPFTAEILAAVTNIGKK